jgi:hypothetical protein
MAKVPPFSSLATADLVIDAVYEGGTKGNTGDDPLGKLISGAGNQGGFRQVGGRESPKLAVLYSSMDDAEWPDAIDIYTGVFTYFGDNKKPGFELHETPRSGNKLLQSCFTVLHTAPDQRGKTPPFLVFTKGSKGRDVVFRGLAVRAGRATPPMTSSLSGAAKTAKGFRITGLSLRSSTLGPSRGSSIAVTCPAMSRIVSSPAPLSARSVNERVPIVVPATSHLRRCADVAPGRL